MFDLQPAADALAQLVTGVRDDQLSDPTPCTGQTVADLLDHVDGLAGAFAAAARKEPETGPPPVADGARLAADFRTRIPQRLCGMAEAWRDPAAWDGTTSVGGVTMPGAVTAAVGADELVVHGWDIAAATGRPFGADPALVAAAHGFAADLAAANPGGAPGLFGPPVPAPAGAPLLHRLLCATGRDPAWRPAVSSAGRSSGS